jgi:hypothetical protein
VTCAAFATGHRNRRWLPELPFNLNALLHLFAHMNGTTLTDPGPYPHGCAYGLRGACTGQDRPAPPVLALVLALTLVLPVKAADQYAYQGRGDRSEGIRLPTAAAADITLISVRAVPVGGPEDRIPERLRLRFALPRERRLGAVQITVRELHDRFDYWLDQVRPATPWRAGQVNVYRWPTRTVLKWLYGRGLQTAELGVLVRLGEADAPPGRERVAPVVLAGDDWPVEIERYLFTFRTRVPARVTCQLEPVAVASPIWGQSVKHTLADHSYSCRVPFPPLPAGEYRLRIESWSLTDRISLANLDVRFYHDPDLR